MITNKLNYELYYKQATPFFANFRAQNELHLKWRIFIQYF